MKTYKVRIKVTKKFEVEVKANSEEEALQMLESQKSQFIDTPQQAYMIDINYMSAQEKKPKIKTGKTIEKYMAQYGEAYNNGDLWDFSVEDVNNGAIELDPDKVYWEIGDRIYETGE